MFDEETYIEGYSCECGGIIEVFEGVWSCNQCGFRAADRRSEEIADRDIQEAKHA